MKDNEFLLTVGEKIFLVSDYLLENNRVKFEVSSENEITDEDTKNIQRFFEDLLKPH